MNQTNLKRVLRQVMGREHITKIRQFQHGGEKWFPENKNRIKEEIEKAYVQYEHERMERLFRDITLNQREITFDADLPKEKILPDLMKKIPNDIQSNLEKYKIHKGEIHDLFDATEFKKWIMEKINKIYTEEGFIVQVAVTSGWRSFVVYSNIEKLTDAQFKILWSIPSFYDQDLSKIDWNDLYKKLQVQMYVKKIGDRYRYDISNKITKQNYYTLSKAYDDSEYTKTYNLPFEEMYNMHKKEIDTWLADVTKGKTDRPKSKDFKPAYLLKLGKPEEIEKITSTQTEETK
jgi:uncharacterized protein YcbK (DUF882 family)